MCMLQLEEEDEEGGGQDVVVPLTAKAEMEAEMEAEVQVGAPTCNEVLFESSLTTVL